MKPDDQITIEWESVEVCGYRQTVSMEQFAALTGVPVAELLTYDDPSDVTGPLDLADELATVEDEGKATETLHEFTREGIITRVKRRRKD